MYVELSKWGPVEVKFVTKNVLNFGSLIKKGLKKELNSWLMLLLLHSLAGVEAVALLHVHRNNYLKPSGSCFSWGCEIISAFTEDIL